MKIISVSRNISNIAVLGEDVLDFFTDYLEQYLTVGQDVQIYQGSYNAIELEIVDEHSDLYKFNPKFVIILFSIDRFFERYSEIEEKTLLHNEYSERISAIVHTLITRLQCQIIISNLPYKLDPIFGNYGHKLEDSFSTQIIEFNYFLSKLSRRVNEVKVIDVSSLHSILNSEIRDERMFYSSSTSYNLEFYNILAKHSSEIINVTQGSVIKCVILDLDNTLWGGVIGDDGLDGIQLGKSKIGKAFRDFQKWIKLLKNRGIILCVNSKNNEEIAMEPFLEHEEMILKLDDIAVFVANWDNKADNIRYIQNVLNIGFDSMLFIDDNPSERDQVQMELPDVLVPDMPDDPTEYLHYLTSLNLVETNSYSVEDSERTKKYQEENRRMKTVEQFSSMDKFLESLSMCAEIIAFNKTIASRCAQLSQRSNQFNLRTIRYSESDIDDIIQKDSYFGFAVKLNDKFGDYGLVSLLVAMKTVDSFFIENWVMSCRVLKRNVELLVLNYLVEKAKELNIKYIIGEYIPTPKNSLVKDHYLNLGFQKKEERWVLDVDSFSVYTHQINIKQI